MSLDPGVVRIRRAPAVLGAALVAASALMLLALLVGVHPPQAWDRHVFAHLHGRAGDPAARFAADLTQIGDGPPLLAMLSLLAVAVWVRWRTWSALVVTGLAVVTSAAISTLLKLVIDRERPPSTGWLASAHGTSFPSGHTTVATAGYLAMGLSVAALARTQAARSAALGAGITVALAIGWTRVELAVHWPTDVLAGWCLGAAAACASALIGPALIARELPAEPGAARAAGA